jgi:hypothetical protein
MDPHIFGFDHFVPQRFGCHNLHHAVACAESAAQPGIFQAGKALRFAARPPHAPEIAGTWRLDVRAAAFCKTSVGTSLVGAH